jgi:hypothetical protein
MVGAYALQVVCVPEPRHVHWGNSNPFPGLKPIDKPILWVFPKFIVCLDCGTTEFTVPKSELRQLAKRRRRCDRLNLQLELTS